MQIRRKIDHFIGSEATGCSMKLSPISFLYIIAIGLCFLAAFYR